MMAAYAGRDDVKDTTYECVADGNGGWDRSAWYGPNGNDGPKSELIKRNPLINLPYVIDHTRGVVVTQSNACYQYVARELGLYGGGDPVRETECDQLLCQVMDLRNAVVALFYRSRDRENYVRGMGRHIETTLKGEHYGKLEAWLEAKAQVAGVTDETPVYFVDAGKPLAPDFHIWEMIDQHFLAYGKLTTPERVAPLDPDECFTLAGHKRLRAFYKAFRKLPELRGYFGSDAYKMPVNNPMAFFT